MFGARNAMSEFAFLVMLSKWHFHHDKSRMMVTPKYFAWWSVDLSIVSLIS